MVMIKSRTAIPAKIKDIASLTGLLAERFAMMTPATVLAPLIASPAITPSKTGESPNNGIILSRHCYSQMP